MSTETTPNYLGDLWNLGLDLTRKNSGIDVERVTDDQNMPDMVDVRTNQATPSNSAAQAGPVSPFAGLTWKHYAGLTLAAGLTYGLVTGKFK
jgi:hypothetical protein